MPKNNPMALKGLRTADIPGSWFNDKFSQFYTVHPCRALPIRIFDVPGNAFVDMKFGTKIESLPAESPLYDSWSYAVKAVFCPYRLYLPRLRKNFQLKHGAIENQVLPYFLVTSNVVIQGESNALPVRALGNQNGNIAFLVGSVLERLGYQPTEFFHGMTLNHPQAPLLPFYVNTPTSTTPYNAKFRQRFSLIPYLAYLDTWLNFEYNKQDRYIPVVSEKSVISPYATTLEDKFSQEINYINVEDLYGVIRSFGFGEPRSADYSNHVPLISVSSEDEASITTVSVDFANGNWDLVPGYSLFTKFWIEGDGYDNGVYNFYSTPTGDGNVVYSAPVIFYTDNEFWQFMQNKVSKAGLLPTTLYGDKFTTWFNDDTIAKLSQYKVVNDMTLLELRRKNNNMYLDLLAGISGDAYVDYLQYVFDTALELKDHPIYVGSDVINFNMIDVLSQTQGQEGERNSSLGSTASKAYVRGKGGDVISGKPIKFKTKEPGLLLFYGVLTPRVRYFQGEDRFFGKTTYGSLWHPQFDAQGFSDVLYEEMYKLVGGQPSVSTINVNIWSNLETPNNKSYNEDNVAINRVPVGWEYMIHESRASAGARLPWFRPWSLVRDFNDFYGSWRHPFEATSMWLNHIPDLRNLRSTYGNESSFNYNFANVGQDAENFIVLTEFEYSRYIPISKNLLQRDL